MLEANKTRQGSCSHWLKPLREKYPTILHTVPYLQSEAFEAQWEDRKKRRLPELLPPADHQQTVAPADFDHRPSDLLLFGTISFESGQLEIAYKFLCSLCGIQ